MEIKLIAFILIALSHFIGDFIFQTREMAINKGTNNWWLTMHVLAYMNAFIPLILYEAFIVIETSTAVIVWLILNGILHWITDYLTSRLNKKLKSISEKWFFTGIGFDQTIHYITLVLTWIWLVN